MTLPLLLAALLATAGPAPQEPGDELREFCPLYRVFFHDGSARIRDESLRINWRRHHGNLICRSGSRYYLRRGVPPDRVRIEARGETSPMAPFDPGQSAQLVRAMNRYVQVSPEMPVALFRRFFPAT